MSLEDLTMVLNCARIQLINSEDGAVEGLFDEASDIPENYLACEVDDVYPYRIDRENHSDEEPVLCVCISRDYYADEDYYDDDDEDDDIE